MSSMRARSDGQAGCLRSPSPCHETGIRTIRLVEADQGVGWRMRVLLAGEICRAGAACGRAGDVAAEDDRKRTLLLERSATGRTAATWLGPWPDIGLTAIAVLRRAQQWFLPSHTRAHAFGVAAKLNLRHLFPPTLPHRSAPRLILPPSHVASGIRGTGGGQEAGSVHIEQSCRQRQTP
nr:hypothetical protein CFP56_21899 [Quercus suber]